MPSGKKPQGICLDKGYDYLEVWELLEEFGFTAHIAVKGQEAPSIKRTAPKKARRWVNERTHSCEPLPRHPHPLVQETPQLSRTASSGLRHHQLPLHGVIRIGSKFGFRSLSCDSECVKQGLDRF
jgi:hypothetical protein